MTLSDFILAFKGLEKETRGRCFYCGTQTSRSGLNERCAAFQTKDHVVPVSAKGHHAAYNRVVCCRKCNATKKDLTLQEFKLKSGLKAFYAETLLGVRVEDLDDIEAVATHVKVTRKPQFRKRPRIPSLTPATDNQQG